MSTLQLPPAVQPNDTRSQDYKVIHEKLCIDINLEEQSLNVSTRGGSSDRWVWTVGPLQPRDLTTRSLWIGVGLR
jgi:hypothetical protein